MGEGFPYTVLVYTVHVMCSMGKHIVPLRCIINY